MTDKNTSILRKNDTLKTSNQQDVKPHKEASFLAILLITSSITVMSTVVLLVAFPLLATVT